MSDDFEDYQERTHPPGHRGTWGSAWGRAWGRQKDKTVTRARDAVTAGHPSRAPADSLEHHLADRALERLAGEADTSVRARVLGAWDFWPWAGRRTGVEAALELLGWAATLYTASQIGATPWAQWWAVAVTSGVSTRYWSASDAWGSGVWGSDASRDTVRQSRRFLRSVSNARDIGWLVLSLDGTAIWGPGTWGTPATWGSATTRWRI